MMESKPMFNTDVEQRGPAPQPIKLEDMLDDDCESYSAEQVAELAASHGHLPEFARTIIAHPLGELATKLVLLSQHQQLDPDFEADLVVSQPRLEDSIIQQILNNRSDDYTTPYAIIMFQRLSPNMVRQLYSQHRRDTIMVANLIDYHAYRGSYNIPNDVAEQIKADHNYDCAQHKRYRPGLQV